MPADATDLRQSADLVKTPADLARVLIKFGAVWIILDAADRVTGYFWPAPSYWASDSSDILVQRWVYQMWILFIAAAGVSYYLWTHASRIAVKINAFIESARLDVGPGLQFRERFALQLVGVWAMIRILPTLSDAVTSGLRSWEYVDETGFGFEHVIGFQSYSYWTMAAEHWYYIAFSMSLGLWLILVHTPKGSGSSYGSRVDQRAMPVEPGKGDPS